MVAPFFVVPRVLETVFFGALMAHSTLLTRWAQRRAQWYFTLKLLLLCGIWVIQMFVVHVYLTALFFYFHEGWAAQVKWGVAVTLQVVFLTLPMVIDWWMTAERNRVPAEAPSTS